MKNVQIDRQLFADIYKYICAHDDCDAIAIKRKLDDKIDRLVARDIYTDYRQATSNKDREKYRQEYIKHKTG